MFRGQIRTGGIKPPVRGVPKISHPFVMLADMIINDLISPQPTASYDQVTGPNAMYNNPKLSEEQRRVIYESVHGSQQGSMKADVVNRESQEQSLRKLQTRQQTLEPIIINNSSQTESTGDQTVSHINSKGDMGFDELYPSLYN